MTASAPSTEKGRIAELDGIRGLAILLVLVFHYPVQNLVTDPGSLAAYAVKWLHLTWSGVDLFFVLSGFLIGGILIDNRGAKNFFRAFYVRRACRIFPLYYFFLLLFALAVGANLLAWRPSLGWTLDQPLPLWSFFLYVQNFVMASTGEFGPNFAAVTWSLAIEEQFYLLFPLVVWLCPPRWLPHALIVLILCAPVFRTVLYFAHPHAGKPGFLLLPGRWDSLLIGVLAAWWFRAKDFTAQFASWEKRLLLTCGALGLGVMAFPFLKIDSYTLAMSSFGHTWLAVFYALVILLVLRNTAGLGRLFRLRPLVWLGGIAYGVYLYHQVVKGFCYSLLLAAHPRLGNLADFGVGALALLLTLVIASASWHWFEKPIVKLGHRYRYDGA